MDGQEQIPDGYTSVYVFKSVQYSSLKHAYLLDSFLYPLS